jgi:hypothetical protein
MAAPTTKQTRTLRNDRNGGQIVTPYSDAEACEKFAQHFGGKDSWLWYWMHKYVLDEEAKQTRYGDRDADRAMQFIADIFVYAIGHPPLVKETKTGRQPKARAPMIRCHYEDRRFKFYISKHGSILLKTGALRPGTHDPIGAEEYCGRIARGRFEGPNYGNPPRAVLPVEQEFLTRLKEAPVTFLAQCSKDMGRCCYCNLPLSDPRSKIVGYGATCAVRWGLPWGDPKYLEGAPSFAKEYMKGDEVEEVQGLLYAIRDNPQDEKAWFGFSIWLSDRDLPPCKMPDVRALFPKNS